MVIFTQGVAWVDGNTIAPYGEALLSLPVSRAARRAYLDAHPALADNFRPIRDGYRMTGYESQIAACRALGHDAARREGRPVHRFDAADAHDRSTWDYGV